MKMNFDRGWKFHLGDIPTPPSANLTYREVMTGNASGPAAPNFNDAGWRTLDLPHDWVVEGMPAPDQIRSQGYLPTGLGWYRKKFYRPDSKPAEKFFLEFEGVFRNSTAWLNGIRLGHHASGYTGFTYEITDFLAPANGENTLAVRVDASKPEGWWYEGGGIYRHVWLILKEALRLDHDGVIITTPRVSEKSARVAIRTAVRNDSDLSRDFELTTSILDARGRPVAEAKDADRLEAGGLLQLEQKIVIENPALWSPETPSLYRVVSRLRSGGRMVDQAENPLGLRWYEFTADHGFFLNGRPCKIQGTCNHQDFAGVGVALPDRLHYKKIEILKELGCNAYRCAHHPPAPVLLEACDRLGLLVMDENRHLDSSEAGLADLRAMIRRDRNHPSVILWSLENEEGLEGHETGSRILRRLYRTAREEDPTRPVTAAISHGWNGAGYADIIDVAGYNYSPQRYAPDHRDYPQRRMLGSEIISALQTRGRYETADGYCSSYGDTRLGHNISIEEGWSAVAEPEFMAGGFVWAGFDYRGEPTPYDWPVISAHYGMLDICGFPKDASYYFRAAWQPAPVLHIFPHWNWPGREGQEIKVWCYTNCEKVELFLNGRSLGEKTAVPLRRLEWPVPYQPGELKAVGRRQGRRIGPVFVRTAGAPDRLILKPDRGRLANDGTDVGLVRVEVVDSRGLVVPNANNWLTFRVEGAGRLLGLGNGDPKDHQNDKSTRRRAFNGLCLALLQSGREKGELRLTVRAEGLPEASTCLKVG